MAFDSNAILLRDAVWRYGSGSPVGTVTPLGDGTTPELYQDTATSYIYVATGATNSDWTVIGPEFSNVTVPGITVGFESGSSAVVTPVAQNMRVARSGNLVNCWLQCIGSIQKNTDTNRLLLNCSAFEPFLTQSGVPVIENDGSFATKFPNHTGFSILAASDGAGGTDMFIYATGPEAAAAQLDDSHCDATQAYDFRGQFSLLVT